jgi:hypothetical protein
LGVHRRAEKEEEKNRESRQLSSQGDEGLQVLPVYRQNDDFASMREVVTRRYRRVQEEKEGDASLVLIDGGVGSCTLRRTRWSPGNHQPAAGQYREERRVLYVYGQEDEPMVLDRHSPVLHLIQQIRDETHRFAVTFHGCDGKAADAERAGGDSGSGCEDGAEIIEGVRERSECPAGRSGAVEHGDSAKKRGKSVGQARRARSRLTDEGVETG